MVLDQQPELRDHHAVPGRSLASSVVIVGASGARPRWPEAREPHRSADRQFPAAPSSRVAQATLQALVVEQAAAMKAAASTCSAATCAQTNRDSPQTRSKHHETPHRRLAGSAGRSESAARTAVAVALSVAAAARVDVPVMVAALPLDARAPAQNSASPRTPACAVPPAAALVPDLAQAACAPRRPVRAAVRGDRAPAARHDVDVPHARLTAPPPRRGRPRLRQASSTYREEVQR